MFFVRQHCLKHLARLLISKTNWQSNHLKIVPIDHSYSTSISMVSIHHSWVLLVSIHRPQPCTDQSLTFVEQRLCIDCNIPYYTLLYCTILYCIVLYCHIPYITFFLLNAPAAALNAPAAALNAPAAALSAPADVHLRFEGPRKCVGIDRSCATIFHILITRCH